MQIKTKMVEAQIICICPSIWIADLNLNMKKGQSALISKERADASKDLVLAKNNHGVEVTYVERFRELREPSEQPKPETTPPIPRPFRPKPVVKETIRETVRVERTELDEEALANRLADRMGSLRDNRTNDLIEGLIRQVQNLQAQLATRPQVVREIVHSNGRVVEDDAPVFIPETIISEDTKDVDLQIKETVSEGTVDDAAAALRALRLKKKGEML